jgi:hypothetical protein
MPTTHRGSAETTERMAFIKDSEGDTVGLMSQQPDK